METLREKRDADRHLTPEQRAKIIQELRIDTEALKGELRKPIGQGQVLVILYLTDNETRDFANEIHSLFKQADWPWAFHEYKGAQKHPVGLILVVKDLEQMPLPAVAVLRRLDRQK